MLTRRVSEVIGDVCVGGGRAKTVNIRVVLHTTYMYKVMSTGRAGKEVEKTYA